YEKKTSTISLKKQMEKLKNEIFTNFPEANSLEDLKKDLIIRKSQIEAEGISLTDYKDGLLNKMNIEKEKLYREIEREKEEIVEIKSKISENRGKLSNITEILDKYARLKQEISDKENNLKKIIKSQSAYQKLSSIVSDMINDVTMIFNQISKEISDEFSDFFPHFKGIEIKSIDKIDDFYLNDKYEEKRSIDHLSSGTRDMFLLAFRTLLAKKFGIGNFLIFDEPFMALDQERIETMLKILKRFYDKYNWQFIFLTKDPQLKNLIIKQFGQKVKVEELE
ncbi:MAG: hypothetical protein N2258_07605, partial [Brevinematales bacterium]|nr:hypothetical protein [Brevinematales bacterium]